MHQISLLWAAAWGCSIPAQLEELLFLHRTPGPCWMEPRWPPSAPMFFPSTDLTYMCSSCSTHQDKYRPQGDLVSASFPTDGFTGDGAGTSKKNKKKEEKSNIFRDKYLRTWYFTQGHNGVFYRHQTFSSDTYRQHFTSYSLLNRSEAFYLLAEITEGCSEKHIVFFWFKIMAGKWNSLGFAFCPQNTS